MTFADPAVAGASRAAQAARDKGPLLELAGVSKRFPGVVALDRVDFDLRHGEAHVLFGENGAGKSTLINIIAGTYPPDEGAFTYQGEAVGRLTPHAARLLGISPVFQEFSLAPELTVEQNLFLGRELTRGGVLDRSGMEAKAEKLFSLVDKVKASGVGVIYVSHRMREIKQIADRITVLRDGRKITTVNAAD